MSWEDREGGETLPVAGMWSALAPGLFLGCKVMTIDKIVIVSRASSDLFSDVIEPAGGRDVRAWVGTHHVRCTY